ncbi:hypothetical protein BDY24DRAFT_390714, partial [Mrakia frigida]|uniref:uncharacterized protein n=1 Tax=Mrakia frigida TaxID=29902 RepID=UPI003FCBF9C2
MLVFLDLVRQIFSLPFLTLFLLTLFFVTSLPSLQLHPTEQSSRPSSTPSSWTSTASLPSASPPSRTTISSTGTPTRLAKSNEASRRFWISIGRVRKQLKQLSGRTSRDPT